MKHRFFNKHKNYNDENYNDENIEESNFLIGLKLILKIVFIGIVFIFIYIMYLLISNRNDINNWNSVLCILEKGFMIGYSDYCKKNDIKPKQKSERKVYNNQYVVNQESNIPTDNPINTQPINNSPTTTSTDIPNDINKNPKFFDGNKNWKYTSNPNDIDCLNNWDYYASDQKTLLQEKIPVLTTMNKDDTWCATSNDMLAINQIIIDNKNKDLILAGKIAGSILLPEIAEKLALEAAEAVSKRAATQISEKAAQEAIEKAVQEATEKALQEATEKLAQEAAEAASKRAIAEMAEKTAQEAAEKAAQEASEAALKRVAAEATEKAAQEAAKKAAQEVAEKLAIEAAEATARRIEAEAAEKIAQEAVEATAKAAKKAAEEAAELAIKQAAELATKRLALENAQKLAAKASQDVAIAKATSEAAIKEAKKIAQQITDKKLSEGANKLIKAAKEAEDIVIKAADEVKLKNKTKLLADDVVKQSIKELKALKSIIKTSINLSKNIITKQITEQTINAIAENMAKNTISVSKRVASEALELAVKQALELAEKRLILENAQIMAAKAAQDVAIAKATSDAAIKEAKKLAQQVTNNTLSEGTNKLIKAAKEADDIAIKATEDLKLKNKIQLLTDDAVKQATKQLKSLKSIVKISIDLSKNIITKQISEQTINKIAENVAKNVLNNSKKAALEALELAAKQALQLAEKQILYDNAQKLAVKAAQEVAIAKATSDAAIKEAKKLAQQVTNNTLSEGRNKLIKAVKEADDIVIRAAEDVKIKNKIQLLADDVVKKMAKQLKVLKTMINTSVNLSKNIITKQITEQTINTIAEKTAKNALITSKKVAAEAIELAAKQALQLAEKQILYENAQKLAAKASQEVKLAKSIFDASIKEAKKLSKQVTEKTLSEGVDKLIKAAKEADDIVIRTVENVKIKSKMKILADDVVKKTTKQLKILKSIVDTSINLSKNMITKQISQQTINSIAETTAKNALLIAKRSAKDALLIAQRIALKAAQEVAIAKSTAASTAKLAQNTLIKYNKNIALFLEKNTIKDVITKLAASVKETAQIAEKAAQDLLLKNKLKMSADNVVKLATKELNLIKSIIDKSTKIGKSLNRTLIKSVADQITKNLVKDLINKFTLKMTIKMTPVIAFNYLSKSLLSFSKSLSTKPAVLLKMNSALLNISKKIGGLTAKGGITSAKAGLKAAGSLAKKLLKFLKPGPTDLVMIFSIIVDIIDPMGYNTMQTKQLLLEKKSNSNSQMKEMLFAAIQTQIQAINPDITFTINDFDWPMVYDPQDDDTKGKEISIDDRISNKLGLLMDTIGTDKEDPLVTPFIKEITSDIMSGKITDKDLDNEDILYNYIKLIDIEKIKILVQNEWCNSIPGGLVYDTDKCTLNESTCKKSYTWPLPTPPEPKTPYLPGGFQIGDTIILQNVLSKTYLSVSKNKSASGKYLVDVENTSITIIDDITKTPIPNEDTYWLVVDAGDGYIYLRNKKSSTLNDMKLLIIPASIGIGLQLVAIYTIKTPVEYLSVKSEGSSTNNVYRDKDINKKNGMWIPVKMTPPSPEQPESDPKSVYKEFQMIKNSLGNDEGVCVYANPQMKQICDEMKIPYDEKTGICIIDKAYCLRMGADWKYNDEIKDYDCEIPLYQDGLEMIFGTTITRIGKLAVTGSLESLDGLQDIGNQLLSGKINPEAITIDLDKILNSTIGLNTYNGKGIVNMAYNTFDLSLKAIDSTVKSVGDVLNVIGDLNVKMNTFNTTDIKDPKQSYVRTPKTPDYYVYNNVDSKYNDIKQITSGKISDMITACNSDKTCVGFNSGGYLKNKVNILKPNYDFNNSAGGFYIKYQADLNNIQPDYAYYHNYDTKGSFGPGIDKYQISGSNVFNYLNACNNNASCTGFNSNGWLKNRIKYELDNSFGTGLYVKTKKISNEIPNDCTNGTNYNFSGIGNTLYYKNPLTRLLPCQGLYDEDIRNQVLIVTNTGNLVLYDINNNKKIFESKTSTKTVNGVQTTNYFVFKNDSLNIINSIGEILWTLKPITSNELSYIKLYSGGYSGFFIYDTSARIVYNTSWLTSVTPNSWINDIANNGNRGKVLKKNEFLYMGEQILSSNSNFRLVMQNDGILAIWDLSKNNTGEKIWNSRNKNDNLPNVLCFQSDGNLVIYDNSRTALWNSGTSNSDAQTLYIQNDRNLVLYDSKDKPLWNTNTTLASPPPPSPSPSPSPSLGTTILNSLKFW